MTYRDVIKHNVRLLIDRRAGVNIPALKNPKDIIPKPFHQYGINVPEDGRKECYSTDRMSYNHQTGMIETPRFDSSDYTLLNLRVGVDSQKVDITLSEAELAYQVPLLLAVPQIEEAARESLITPLESIVAKADCGTPFLEVDLSPTELRLGERIKEQRARILPWRMREIPMPADGYDMGKSNVSMSNLPWEVGRFGEHPGDELILDTIITYNTRGREPNVVRRIAREKLRGNDREAYRLLVRFADDLSQAA